MWTEILLTIYLIFIVLCLGVFIALLGRRPLRVKSGLIMLPACAALSAGGILQIFFYDLQSLQLLYYFTTFMFLVLFSSFLFFAVEFTGWLDPKKRRNIILLSAVPIFTAVVELTDPWLHLYNSSYVLDTVPGYEVPYLKYEPTIFNWFFTIFCFVIGIFFIIMLAQRLRKYYDRAIFYVFVVGAIFAYALNTAALFLDELKILPLDGLTVTIVALFFYIAALVFGMFDLAPMARKEMLDVMQDGIFIMDAKGVLSDANKSGLELIDAELEDIIGQPIDLIALKYPEVTELMKQDGSYPSIQVDSKGRFFEARLLPFDYGRIKHIGHMLVLHDITERKEAELTKHEAETKMRLAESDRRYRALINNQTEAIITFDLDGRITFGNPVYERWMERLGKDISGMAVKNILTPEDATALMALIHRATPTDPEFQFEHTIIITPDEEGWIHWNGKAIFDPEGHLVEVQAAGMDITEKKRSEAEYRAIVESQKEMILRRNSEGKITFANQAYSSYFQKPFSELVGTKYIPPSDEDDLAVMRAAISSLTPEQPDRDYILMKVFMKNDVTRWTEWKVRGIFDSLGRMVEYQMVGYDITDRLKMEQELVKTQKLESIGLLAGGIAHDFNNLLTSIVSNIEVAAKEMPLGERPRRRLDDAVRSAMSAKRLTQQLLTFSKGGKPVKEYVDVETLIKTNVEFTLTGTNVVADYSFEDGIPPILADPFQIGQVINNLVINAVQAMPEGGRVRIDASNFEVDQESNLPFEEDCYVKISIIDQGVGIPSMNLTKIFDPFFTTKDKGSGLGLSTVQSIVKNHRGYIDVDSTAGVGSTFTLFLPSERTAKLQVGPSSERASSFLPALHILIMDDDESILDVLSTILVEMGHTVDQAHNGEQAIPMVRQNRTLGQTYDLYIMDLTIKGGMGGKEAIKHILELGPSAKAIVSSGYSNDPVMAEPLAYGFIGVLQKPYTMNDLVEKMTAILKKD
ncbi:MAG: sensory histidine kinase AtoS [Methanomassiliicoccales archaeon PtaU1.Bin124]|nr:MAG: sensory histidine kinase AtoS [Methanomassiliicoccales archaeon PtaU1.Bin124]